MKLTNEIESLEPQKIDTNEYLLLWDKYEYNNINF